MASRSEMHRWSVRTEKAIHMLKAQAASELKRIAPMYLGTLADPTKWEPWSAIISGSERELCSRWTGEGARPHISYLTGEGDGPHIFCLAARRLSQHLLPGRATKRPFRVERSRR